MNIAPWSSLHLHDQIGHHVRGTWKYLQKFAIVLNMAFMNFVLVIDQLTRVLDGQEAPLKSFDSRKTSNITIFDTSKKSNMPISEVFIGHESFAKNLFEHFWMAQTNVPQPNVIPSEF